MLFSANVLRTLCWARC